MYYSTERNAFFPTRAPYEEAGTWPDDAIEVTDGEFKTYGLGQPPGGMQRGADENGHPAWVPVPAPTTEQLADTARAERDRLIESVRWRIERHSDELALGSEPTEPLESLLQYTQALRDVPQQAGFPEAVEWPQCP